MIQPQVLLRLPCYDFAPITIHTLGVRLLYRLAKTTLGTNSFHGVTGSVYKVRERIHRVVADTRLLAISTSWGRVADLNPNLDRLYWFAPPYGIAPLCTGHCNTCVALDIRTMMTWRHPHLPPGFPGSPIRVPYPEGQLQLIARVALVRGLNLTSHDTSWRQPCSTCSSVWTEAQKIVFLRLSNVCQAQVRFLA